MLELEKSNNLNIENMIYEIRGQQVMLDSDLAKLYGCVNGTKTINQAVSRHIERFPYDFRFQLTQEEYNNLKSQVGTTSQEHGGVRKLPHVFTEQGVAMLATVLRTSIATQMSIKIMRAFVSMRKYISSNLLEQKYINNQVMKNTEDIKLLQESFKQFDKTRQINEIFFKGQIYDAYSLLVDILNTADKNIILIDNYIDKKLLDICSKVKANITIYTNNIDKIDLEKYNKQYKNVEIKTIKSFHDRFIIIDRKILYHCGASFKDLGSKCFAINKIENNTILKELLKIIS
ncbi:MAG: ORF6N domain-containing protein [Clostridia bacterium]|nr:ORF6N domain-containing protein [Clostridia bacterium]